MSSWITSAPAAAPTASPVWPSTRREASASRRSAGSVRPTTSAVRTALAPCCAALISEATTISPRSESASRKPPIVTARTTLSAIITSRGPTRSARRPSGVAAAIPATPATVSAIPAWATGSSSTRIRNSAQLAYQAPLPTALASVPYPRGRRMVGSGSEIIVQGNVNGQCTIHADLKHRRRPARLEPDMDERVRLLEDLANPVRYGVLTRLEKGPATASELAAALAVSPTQLANHLRRLRERGLVAARRRGRHATYELAEPGLRELFSVLNELRRDGAPAIPSVAAGTCYDHLSGRLGVALFDTLSEQGALVPDGRGVALGEGAEARAGPLRRRRAGRPAAAHGLPVPRRVGGPPAPRRRARRRAGVGAGRAGVGGAAAGFADRGGHAGGEAGAGAAAGSGGAVVAGQLMTDGLTRGAVATLLAGAESVLALNWTGTSTVPSRRQYPHQWGWDAAYIAFGWAWIDQARAARELESILSGQWADGRVPHIVFHAGVPEDAYFPGPAFWRSAEAPDGPDGAVTSGLTQPPLHARAALEVALHARDGDRADAFLRRVFPRLAAQHAYLARRRDAGGAGLAAIVHPWESGLDDSPSWDEPLRAVALPPGAWRRTSGATSSTSIAASARATRGTTASCTSRGSTATAGTPTTAAARSWSRTRCSTRSGCGPRTRWPRSPG